MFNLYMMLLNFNGLRNYCWLSCNYNLRIYGIDGRLVVSELEVADTMGGFFTPHFSK
jgi:hypothetical protein